MLVLWKICLEYRKDTMIPKYQAWHKAEKKMYSVLALYLQEFGGIEVFDKWVTDFTSGEKDMATKFYQFDDIELREYIGRNDKNGQAVFNGDIIKTGPTKIMVIGEPFIGRVYWHEREFQWWIADDTQDPIMGIDYDVTFLDNYQDFEVIGNNYEHPNLLEKERTHERERAESRD